MSQFEGLDNQQNLDVLAPDGASVLPGHDMGIVNIAPHDVHDGHFSPFVQQAQFELFARLQASAAAQRIPHVAISNSVVLGLRTDAVGDLMLTASVPHDVPSGFKSYYQCWIADATQPLGLAASNALMGETQ